jgi:hypothetical protein
MFDSLDMYEVSLIRGAWQPHWESLVEWYQRKRDGSGHVCHEGDPDSTASVLDYVHQTAGVPRAGPPWQWTSILFERALSHSNPAVQKFAGLALLNLGSATGACCISAEWLSRRGARLLTSPNVMTKAWTIVGKLGVRHPFSPLHKTSFAQRLRPCCSNRNVHAASHVLAPQIIDCTLSGYHLRHVCTLQTAHCTSASREPAFTLCKCCALCSRGHTLD